MANKNLTKYELGLVKSANLKRNLSLIFSRLSYSNIYFVILVVLYGGGYFDFLVKVSANINVAKVISFGEYKILSPYTYSYWFRAVFLVIILFTYAFYIRAKYKRNYGLGAIKESPNYNKEAETEKREDDKRLYRL